MSWNLKKEEKRKKKMRGEIFRRREKINEIDEARKKIIGKHKICHGTGFIKSKIKDKQVGYIKEIVHPCKCTDKFELISKFILSEIPYQILMNQQIYEKTVIDEFSKKKIHLRKEIIRPCIQQIIKLSKNPFGLTFLGKNGTGKTFIGQKLLYYAIIKGFTAHYIEFPHLLRLLRGNFDKNIDGVIKEISEVDFLMIDEVGSESKRSEFAIGELKSLYKKRILKNHLTILVSNYSYTQFKKTYGISIENLIESYSKVFNFKETPNVRKLKTSAQTEAFFVNLQKKVKR